jgi:succinate dehydrogenase/fumarate reductase flavoprotein subunit
VILNMVKKDIIVVGGGAAGFFAAINIAQQAPLKSGHYRKRQTGSH